MFTPEDVYTYHSTPRPGKVEVIPTKPAQNAADLTLAYSPGVAHACTAIEKDPSKAALYTAKNNLIAVITNGTAVLGLGNIGPLAGKPVMEGKGMLFKRFADIDVFDIELDATNADDIIRIVKALEPTFGGINLEDIKAPECFYIEEELKKSMSIPVFHDDQHGTAVISGAGILNAAKLADRPLREMKTVIVGAGAAGIACAHFYITLGISRENIWMFDSKGLIHTGRNDLHPTKAAFAQNCGANPLTLQDVMQGTSVFLGLSAPGMLTPEMVASMAKNPIIFACANPVPEIDYTLAKSVRADLIMGTGRSDFPNQINNVSGFPFIFRGALDVGATQINETMKLAAAHSLAALAQESIPADILPALQAAYPGENFHFGQDYIIPKPLDPRILTTQCPAVAKAAMESGVATRPIHDLGAYAKSLRHRLDASNARIRQFVQAG